MRCLLAIALSFGLSVSLLAQEDPSPSDVAPPPEIVVPTNPEEIPPPSPSDVRVDGREGAERLKVGTIVSGDLELYPRVRVDDPDEIHPRAVPFILGVMDPREGPWHPHYKIKRLLAG